MNQSPVLIAVLDDESRMRSALRRLLQTHGFRVELFETGGDFISAAPTSHPDCLLLDLHMPRMSGFDVLASLNTLRLPVCVIVITGHDEPGNADRAHELGAADYLLKPLEAGTLVNAIRKALGGAASGLS